MAEVPAAREFEAIRSAFGLLTRAPLGEGRIAEASLGRSVGYFPLAGLALGGVAGAAAWLLDGFLAPWPAAVAVVALLALMTGGLHLDGLADTADGLGGGGGDRERALRIMRDSRLGSFGGVALTLVLLGKMAGLAALMGEPASSIRVFWGLVLMSCAGRWCGVLLVRAFPYARPEGLGRRFRDGSGLRELGVATATLAVSLLVADAGGWGAAFAAAAGALALGVWANARLGGLTGDVYGAGIEISEVIFLWMLI